MRERERVGERERKREREMMLKWETIFFLSTKKLLGQTGDHELALQQIG
jgi:hypothetical protein